MDTAQWVWRYRRTGKCRHLLVNEVDSHARCGTYCSPAAGWLGAGNDEEWQAMAKLPICRRCYRHQVEESS